MATSGTKMQHNDGSSTRKNQTRKPNFRPPHTTAKITVKNIPIQPSKRSWPPAGPKCSTTKAVAHEKTKLGSQISRLPLHDGQDHRQKHPNPTIKKVMATSGGGGHKEGGASAPKWPPAAHIFSITMAVARTHKTKTYSKGNFPTSA